MNPRLKALQDELSALVAETNELRGKAERTDAEQARVQAIPGEIKAVQDKIQAERALADVAAGAEKYLNAADLKSMAKDIDAANPDGTAIFKKLRRLRGATARFMTKALDGDKIAAQEAAYRMGLWALASRGHERSIALCKKMGIELTKASATLDIDPQSAVDHSEGVSEDGGYLVPVEFENSLIVLRETFGVFRNYARYTPMSGAVKSRPRRRGGLQAYWAAEGSEPPHSKGIYDNVSLVAKKMMVLTKLTSELSEDSIIDLGDTLAGEMAYAFAKLEDQSGFIGDGTKAHSGITGAATKLFNTYTATGGAGLALGSGNQWSELTLADHQAVVGKLPQYAEGNEVWFCHKMYYANVMLRLMLAAGGVTAAEIAGGAPRRFMGYDVVVTQAMPKSEANSQVPVIFGELSLACDFGDRRATTIRFSEHSNFETDEVGVRATQRIDINVHDAGDATDAGPIVGLVTAAS